MILRPEFTRRRGKFQGKQSGLESIHKTLLVPLLSPFHFSAIGSGKTGLLHLYIWQQLRQPLGLFGRLLFQFGKVGLQCLAVFGGIWFPLHVRGPVECGGVPVFSGFGRGGLLLVPVRFKPRRAFAASLFSGRLGVLEIYNADLVASAVSQILSVGGEISGSEFFFGFSAFE